jgi:hypothetical protein
MLEEHGLSSKHSRAGEKKKKSRITNNPKGLHQSSSNFYSPGHLYW